MGASKIEWTDATWNPIGGCAIKSPGCIHCYAQKLAGTRLSGHPLYAGTTDIVKGKPVFNGKITAASDDHPVWMWPLRWRGAKQPKLGHGKPSTIFVGDMSDLFHDERPLRDIIRTLAVGALSRHVIQILTKRSLRMQKLLSDPQTPELINEAMDALAPAHWHERELSEWPYSRFWLGVSAERQEEADERITHLIDTPAAVRFVSLEPLLGPIDLRNLGGPGTAKSFGAHGWSAIWTNNAIGRAWLDWVIVGGESGPHARPMHPQWARDIRDQCAAAGVAFHFKRHGEWIGVPDLRNLPGGGGPGFGAFDHCRYDHEAEAVRVGKKAAGRLLDGKEHNEQPAQRETGGLRP